MGLKKYDKEAAEAQLKLEEEKKVEETNAIQEDIEANEAEFQEILKQELSEDQNAIKERIEAARAEYNVKNKKQKRISTLISICVLVLLVAALVLMLTLSSTWQPIVYVSLGVMILGLAASFAATKIFKTRLTNEAQIYVATLYNEINNYVFRSEEFSNLEIKPNAEMKDELFIDAKFYKDLRGTRSRNLISVTYNGENLGIADLAATVLVKGKTAPMFLGKYYDYENTYSKEGKRILMQVKGGELSRPIDDIEDLPYGENHKKYVIYSNDEDWNKVLTPKTIKDILELKVDKTLIDVIVSIRPGKTNIGIDYMDEFMNIPVENPLDFANVIRTEKDLEKVLKVLDDIK